MAESLSTLQYLIANKYTDAIRVGIDKRVPFLSFLRTVGKEGTPSGRGDRFYFPIQYGTNQAFYMQSEGGATPTPDQNRTQEGYCTMKYGYGTLRFSHVMLKQARSNPNWFVEQMKFQMKNLVDVVAMDVNTQCWLDGSGALCQVNRATASSTTVTVDNPGNHYLFDYERLHSSDSFGTTATMTASLNLLVTATDSAARYVSSVATSNDTTFTLNTADNLGNDKWLYRYGSVANTISGIGLLLDNYALSSAGTSSFRGSTSTATVMGISRSTYPFWDANVIHNSGTDRELTLDLMDEAALKVTEKNRYGGKPTHCFASIGLQRKYLGLVRDDKRSVNTLELDGGWSGLEYTAGGNTIPIVACPRAYPNSMYFIDKDSMFVFDGGEGWVDEDGSMLSRRAGYSQFDALFYKYMELGCNMPAKNTVLRDLSQ